MPALVTEYKPKNAGDYSLGFDSCVVSELFSARCRVCSFTLTVEAFVLFTFWYPSNYHTVQCHAHSLYLNKIGTSSPTPRNGDRATQYRILQNLANHGENLEEYEWVGLTAVLHIVYVTSAVLADLHAL